ncbi:MAG: hypothetical protein ACK4MM_00625, partial [Fervidobacterium sp.]
MYFYQQQIYDPSKTQQTQNNYDYKSYKDAFLVSSDQLSSELQRIGGPLASNPLFLHTCKALENKNELISNTNPLVNLLYLDSKPLTLIEVNPILKDFIAQMLALRLLASKEVPINNDEDKVLEKVFNYVYPNEKNILNEKNITDDDLKKFFSYFQKLPSNIIFPLRISDPLSFDELSKQITPSYYKEKFNSGLTNDQRPKFDHFFPSYNFFLEIPRRFAQATKTLSGVCNNPDLEVTFDPSKINDILNFGVDSSKDSSKGLSIDLSNYKNWKSDPKNEFAAPESLWRNLLKNKNNKNLLIDIVNNLPDDTKNILIADIDKGELTDNLKLFFNFFGAAATPFILGAIVNAVFLYQIQNEIKDGIFKFSDEGIKIWKNYFDVYTFLVYKNDQKIDDAKVKALLNDETFTQNQTDLLEIKQKLEIQQKINGRGTLDESDINLIIAQLKKFLFSFTIISTASGEGFISQKQLELLDSFWEYTTNNPDKVLKLLGITLPNEEKFKEQVFGLIAKYSFYQFGVYYISPGTEKKNGKIYAVSSLYSIDNFIKDFILEWKNANKGIDELNELNNQKIKIIYGDINQLTELPTQEEQKYCIIKIGYVDKSGEVHYGNKEKIEDILEEGGKIIYFIEDETNLKELNDFFFSNKSIYNTTEKVMAKYRQFSSVSIGQEVTKYEAKAVNSQEATVVSTTYGAFINPENFEFKLYIEPSTNETNPT